MKRLFLLIAVFNSASALSQSRMPKIRIIPEAGVINGDKAVSAMQSITVLGYGNKWALGVGGGLDYYKIRSVPVFTSARYMFGKKENPFFGYANIGYNIAAPLSNQYLHPVSWWTNSSSFSNGIFTDVGVGYTLPGHNNRGFEFSIGYSIKTLRESYTEYIRRDFPPYTNEPAEHSFSYEFNRFVFKVGYRL